MGVVIAKQYEGGESPLGKWHLGAQCEGGEKPLGKWCLGTYCARFIATPRKIVWLTGVSNVMGLPQES